MALLTPPPIFDDQAGVLTEGPGKGTIPGVGLPPGWGKIEPEPAALDEHDHRLHVSDYDPLEEA